MASAENTTSIIKPIVSSKITFMLSNTSSLKNNPVSPVEIEAIKSTYT